MLLHSTLFKFDSRVICIIRKPYHSCGSLIVGTRMTTGQRKTYRNEKRKTLRKDFKWKTLKMKERKTLKRKMKDFNERL